MNNIKHFFSITEGIHVGCHRHEIGCCQSQSHPYVFLQGYFFEGGRCLYNTLNSYLNNNRNKGAEEIIEENWSWLKDNCIAFIDHARSIAVIKAGHFYTSFIYAAANFCNYRYYVDSIPCYKITDISNRSILDKERVKRYVREWMRYNSEKYNVICTNSKVCYGYSHLKEAAGKRFRWVLEFTEEHGDFDTKQQLFDKPVNVGYAKDLYAKAPTVYQILNGEVFTSEEKEHIEKCMVYTKYFKGQKRGWGKLNKLWKNQEELKAAISDIEKERERVNKLIVDCEKRTEENEKLARQKALSKSSLTNWRKDNISQIKYEYEKEYIDSITHEVTTKTVSNYTYNNQFNVVQLRLYKKNRVETSKGAIVELDKAIQLFNMLYDKYISKDIKYVGFEKENIQIEWYHLRHICYRTKKDDLGNSLGYCDWCIQIGCHAIWMEEVKEFCRYYHLENKVHFSCEPLKH